jgi:hypothetical protein
VMRSSYRLGSSVEHASNVSARALMLRGPCWMTTGSTGSGGGSSRAATMAGPAIVSVCIGRRGEASVESVRSAGGVIFRSAGTESEKNEYAVRTAARASNAREGRICIRCKACVCATVRTREVGLTDTGQVSIANYWGKTSVKFGGKKTDSRTLLRL